jgi:ABC-type branched-subunit amino acid transport system ATPase component/ABC-type branched-subunit amino acid transport system permease subunit
MFALTLSADIVFDGVVQGLVYALVAFGLVLIYRATGVINFAQGQIGAFGGYAMAVLYIRYDIPYGLSVPLALLSGVALGVLAELILRRLFTQPRLLLFVATLGITQLIQLLQLRIPIPEEQASSVTYPVLVSGTWEFAGIRMSGPQLTVIVAVPLLMVFLGWLFSRSMFGKQVRATADNAPSAALAGISIRAVSTKVWALAGLLAAFSALLIAPLQGGNIGVVQSALGPKLLLLSLTAAMFGSMRSFPLTVVGGIVVGVVDALFVTWAQVGEVPTGSNIAAIFVLLLVLMLVAGRRAGVTGDDWSFTPKLRSAREELRAHPLYKASTLVGIGVLVALALLVPQFLDKPTDFLRFAVIPIYLIVALSATVLTGWGGQLSLGQFGFAAVGGYMTVYFSQDFPYLVALALGIVVGVLVAVVIGIPALRIKGLFLAVATLGFALAVRSFLVLNDTLAPGGGGAAQLDVDRREGIQLLFWKVQGNDFEGVYYFALLGALVAIVLAWRIRRTGLGRSVIAVRDNEQTASAYTVSATRTKILAFAISGGLAALAGGLLPLAASNGQFTLSPLTFDVEQSLRIIAVVVVGGISSITGAVLGTLVIIALPIVFDGTQQVQLLASGVGILVVLLYFPGGLISIVHGVRDQLLGYITRRSGWKPPERTQKAGVAHLSSLATERSITTDPLVVEHVSVRFGGRHAVEDVSIRVGPGEIVGLIGTNGAGKSTLMNAISGFVPSTGTITIAGREVGHLASYRRAKLGIGRAFQNAKLFGSLTVRETLMVALEARQHSLAIPSMLFLPPSPQAEKRKRREADEIIGHLGLYRYADSLLSELSTGTRRIVELGALLALDCQLMLLDEPTAGVAQRETEAFGPLIRTIREELGASILIIEHDMPMVMSISDRIYCLEAGAVISHGTPTEVRNDPKVIASYLGTDERAIARSGHTAPTG